MSRGEYLASIFKSLISDPIRLTPAEAARLTLPQARAYFVDDEAEQNAKARQRAMENREKAFDKICAENNLSPAELLALSPTKAEEAFKKVFPTAPFDALKLRTRIIEYAQSHGVPIKPPPVEHGRIIQVS